MKCYLNVISTHVAKIVLRISKWKFIFSIHFESCALLDYYSASSGNPLPTFRDKLSVPFSRLKLEDV